MKNNHKISFAFVDEVGCSFDAAQPIFGVGVIVIKDTLELNKKLHLILCEALSLFNKPKSSFEFKYENILQLESQGSLLIQAVDIILGGINFFERTKFSNISSLNPYKTKVAKKIEELLNKKKRLCT